MFVIANSLVCILSRVRGVEDTNVVRLLYKSLAQTNQMRSLFQCVTAITSTGKKKTGHFSNDM